MAVSCHVVHPWVSHRSPHMEA